MNSFRILLIAFLFATLAGCDMKKDADTKLGDQNFKTAIALIELHKVRTGAYPENLKELKFPGGWDGVATGAVEYKRLPAGYELNLTRGWIGQPELNYPKEFWQGLGVVKSNLKPGT